MTSQEISEKINKANRLDFGTIFNESIELFKKSIVYGFVMQIVIIIVSIPVLLLFYVPMIVAITSQNNLDGDSDVIYNTWLNGFSILSMILFLLGMIVIGVFVMAIRAGFIKILRSLDQDMEVSTKDLFYFFKKKYLINILLLILATFAIAIIAAVLLFLPLIYAIVPLSFMIVIFAFNPDLAINENISLSFKLGTKKWLLSFGLIIITSILASLVGFLLCGIGILFTASFVYHPLYIIYKKVIGFGQNSLEPFSQ